MRTGTSLSGPGMVRSSTLDTSGPGERFRSLALARATSGLTVSAGGRPRAATVSITCIICGSNGISYLYGSVELVLIHGASRYIQSIITENNSTPSGLGGFKALHLSSDPKSNILRSRPHRL